jgi:hypothetical protein
MAGPYAGFATTLKIGSTAVVAVRDIAGPGISTTVIDASTRDSRAKAFLPGMYDGGEITFDIAYDPDTATHGATGIVALQLAGTVSSWVVTFPDTTPATCTFSGFVTGFSVKAPMDDLLSADVTVKVSGVPVWA